MPPGLAQRVTLISSNYPFLEHIFMVPKVFEPLKFYCSSQLNQVIALAACLSFKHKLSNKKAAEVFLNNRVGIN